MPLTEVSQHAQARMQQRGITPGLLQLLAAYGDKAHDHHGGQLRYFSKAARRRLLAQAGHQLLQIDGLGHMGHHAAGQALLPLRRQRMGRLADDRQRRGDLTQQARRLEAMGTPKYVGLTRKKNKRIVWNGSIVEDHDSLAIPYRWKKPRKVFVNSMSDLFHANLHVASLRAMLTNLCTL